MYGISIPLPLDLRSRKKVIQDNFWKKLGGFETGLSVKTAVSFLFAKSEKWKNQKQKTQDKIHRIRETANFSDIIKILEENHEGCLPEFSVFATERLPFLKSLPVEDVTLKGFTR